MRHIIRCSKDAEVVAQALRMAKDGEWLRLKWRNTAIWYKPWTWGSGYWEVDDER